MDELIEKALIIQKDDDNELKKLLEESGFVIAALLVKLIGTTQDEIEDVLQDDLDQILDIVDYLFEHFDKFPGKRKVKRVLNKRSFVLNFEEQVEPGIKNGFDECGQALAQIYNTNFNYDDITKKTKKEFEKWLRDLPKIMKLSTDNQVSKLIEQAFDEGKGVNWLRARLSESYEFSYARSRTTAITELLTMQSYGAYENIMQTDSVTGAKWRHSGGVKEPRENHETLDGTIVKKGNEFDLGTETCLFPRQPKLSAKERVRCHCWLEPVVDEKYFEEG
ncbi:hypothetical protein CBF34_07090 [Vagococcus penaei]|uniref:phage minor head protein n=1 Tax=Vagococcus penaei TaxID=633807 RepID=UPI000F87BFC6|nr:phage minor head protein [Vagococcus penaei]RSU01417.1 hypothetical protein CBF34_07090 [Vagococcus penaei]